MTWVRAEDGFSRLLRMGFVCTAVLVGVLISPASGAETVRLAVTADNSIMAHPKETRLNDGANSIVKLKGRQHIMLVNFPAEVLRGRVVKRATYHVHFARSDNPSIDYLHRVGVSTVASPWVEGTGRAEETAGASCFEAAALGKRPWAYRGSDFTAVSFGQGHTIYDSVEATQPDDEDWQTIAVEPRLLEACVAGISNGLAFYDDLGSDWTITDGQWRIRNLPNRTMHGREQSRFAPYFSVEVAEADTQPPAAPTALPAEPGDLPAGQVWLRFRVPRDQGPAGVLGYFVRYQPGEDFAWDEATPLPRYLIPLASKPGSVQRLRVRDLDLKPGATYTFGIGAVDAAGNLGPVAVVSGKASARDPLYRFAAPALALPTVPGAECRVGNVRVYALDECDRVDAQGKPVGGLGEEAKRANHLWDAGRRRVSLRSARGEFVGFQLIFEGKAKQAAVEVGKFQGPGAARPTVELWREWYVAKANRHLPDPLVPYRGPFAIPDPEQKVPGQRAQGVLVTVYVPHDVEPGSHRATITVSVDGQWSEIELAIEVLPFDLPDELSFRVELNSYGTPGGEAERNYYRLAHLYRCCVNHLPYSQSGHVSAGCAPKLVGDRLDWSAWDARFGPYLDGSAFADLPRAGVPLGEFYLPLHENWPGDVRKAWNGNYWADDAFPEWYRTLFVNVCRQFAQHFRAKGWTRTQFQFYLNNKNSWKVEGSRSGSSPWVLDEPEDQKDFAALAWFARAFHQGIDEVKGDVDLVFRIDISRPQWQRNTLSGLVGLAVVSQSSFGRYNRMVRERAERNGEMLFSYGSPNELDQSNTRMVGWAVRAWCRGADGILPWQTMGRDASWDDADRLAVLYPAKKRFGYDGAYPSLRLLALRRGQQDVEYVNALLRSKPGLHRGELARAIVVALGLADEQTGGIEAFDLGAVDFSGLDASDFARLRRRLQQELTLARPAR